MIGALKPYPEYKESRMPWVGLMPSHWQKRRAKVLFSERVEKGFPDEPLLAATQTKGVVRKADYGSRTVTAQKDLHLLKLVEAGDFVISLRSFEGGIEVAHCRGIISPAYTVLVPKTEARRGFYAHFFKSPDFIHSLTLFVTGIREGQNIDYERMSRAYMPVPPVAEQEAIARFLDRANRRVNRFVRTKNKIIALLNEQKQAIIYRAVTRGLDPNAPLKHSRISWLGEVPEHWRVIRLCYLTRRIVDGTHFTPRYVDEGVPFLRVTDIHEAALNLSRLRKISMEEHHELNRRCMPEKGDLLLSKNGTIGLTKVVDWEFPFSIFVSLCLIKPIRSLIDPYFLSLVFKGGLLHQQLIEITKTTSVTNLHLEKIRGLIIPVPPLEEQGLILQQIHKDVALLEETVKRAEREIELIREYRIRLVADVVTGKLDVREAAAKLPVEVDPGSSDQHDAVPDFDEEARNEEMDALSEEIDA